MTSNAASHPVRTQRSEPRLSPELESMVLDTHQDLCEPADLTWLWVGGRHVSKHFRCEIERIFRTKFLPETLLRGDSCDTRCQIPSWVYLKSGQSAVSDGNIIPFFTLDHFSDDQTRAFFKCRKHGRPYNRYFRRLREKQLAKAIQASAVVNDTGLPDLQMNDEIDEISFDWKGILDQLTGEEHVFNTIRSRHLGWHLEPGKVLSRLSYLLQPHRKLARRSRFLRGSRAGFYISILDPYTHKKTWALKTSPNIGLAASSSEISHTSANIARCNCIRCKLITLPIILSYYIYSLGVFGRAFLTVYTLVMVVYLVKKWLHSVHESDHIDKNFAVLTKPEVLDELPDDTVIRSKDRNPGPKPGSIPRERFTDGDDDSPESQRQALPLPSAVDLFSSRPLLQHLGKRFPVDLPPTFLDPLKIWDLLTGLTGSDDETYSDDDDFLYSYNW